MNVVILQQLGVALALSSLIGLERESKYQKSSYAAFGGIRTFALIGILGALSYGLFPTSQIFFSVMTVGFLALVVAGYVMLAGQHKDMGATSEVAAILVYFIGVLSAMEHYVVATTIALAVMIILHFKDPLHKWARHISNSEMISTIQFMIIAFIVLPLLPNQYMGPYDFFNPYLVWLMVVFISGISFLSYIAMRVFGEKKGITLTGFLAGFISSTALAISLAHYSKGKKNVSSPIVFAMLIAGSTLFVRVLVEVFVVNPELFTVLLWPFVLMAGVGFSIATFFWLTEKSGKEVSRFNKKTLEMESPFRLRPALKFGLIFSGILFISKYALVVMGDRGVFITSFITGLLDVDAITISMANMVKNSDLSQNVGAIAILIAAVVNTMVKVVFFTMFGDKKIALKLLGYFALAVLAGILCFMLLFGL